VILSHRNKNKKHKIVGPWAGNFDYISDKFIIILLKLFSFRLLIGNLLIINCKEILCWWLMPIILATQEAEIKRIAGSKPARQIVHDTLYWKNPTLIKG
jgi:hypothetical protein